MILEPLRFPQRLKSFNIKHTKSPDNTSGALKLTVKCLLRDLLQIEYVCVLLPLLFFINLTLSGHEERLHKHS